MNLCIHFSKLFIRTFNMEFITSKLLLKNYLSINNIIKIKYIFTTCLLNYFAFDLTVQQKSFKENVFVSISID